MKKVITLTAVVALSLASFVEAKRAGSKPVRSAPPAVQKQAAQPNATQQKADADFNTTAPKQAAPTQPTAQRQGSNLANFATGAMAGYLLSDMLSPTEAQAQEKGATQAEPVKQLTEQVQQTVPQVPSFKAIDPQNDPFLIEKTAGYLRYCLNGVQYLVSTANTQLLPTLMVDRTNAPAQCVISQ